jgi:hypothetical protein
MAAPLGAITLQNAAQFCNAAIDEASKNRDSGSAAQLQGHLTTFIKALTVLDSDIAAPLNIRLIAANDKGPRLRFAQLQSLVDDAGKVWSRHQVRLTRLSTDQKSKLTASQQKARLAVSIALQQYKKTEAPKVEQGKASGIKAKLEEQQKQQMKSVEEEPVIGVEEGADAPRAPAMDFFPAEAAPEEAPPAPADLPSATTTKIVIGKAPPKQDELKKEEGPSTPEQGTEEGPSTPEQGTKELTADERQARAQKLGGKGFHVDLSAVRLKTRPAADKQKPMLEPVSKPKTEAQRKFEAMQAKKQSLAQTMQAKPKPSTQSTTSTTQLLPTPAKKGPTPTKAALTKPPTGKPHPPEGPPPKKPPKK